jgi:hypothetical protein
VRKLGFGSVQEFVELIRIKASSTPMRTGGREGRCFVVVGLQTIAESSELHHHFLVPLPATRGVDKWPDLCRPG